MGVVLVGDLVLYWIDFKKVELLILIVMVFDNKGFILE